ncbi:hypothetical protein [Longimicrobium sp.]|uniref:lipopolysaccharide biosynthesis protein n=1 Tax=Longimicrobium sp. TaxID=2029185 RepID=UPI002EDB7F93
MSRTRRAGIAATFGYLQFGVALAAGILVVPFVLSRVGAEPYGVWLGFGELVAYSAMADLGVLAVLPWLVAEADGRADRDEMRGLVATGGLAAILAAVLFAALSLALLTLAPGLTGVTPEQRATVMKPLLFLVAGTAAVYPVRVFHSVLLGLQDVTFLGMLGIAQSALNVVLLVVLLAAGQGLYALAAAATIPALVSGVASLVRLWTIAPDLLRGWRLPTARRLGDVTVQGIGAWTGGLGWRMVSASSTLILLSVAGPAAAVTFALTARLGDVLTQMSWQMPDAGLVGLAQLRGEGNRERTNEVVVSIFRLTLIGSGAVACSVLAFNPSFVALWVGPDRFAGLVTNALLAAGVLSLSLGHAVFVTASTLGARVQIGAVSIAQGIVHVLAAIWLGRQFGTAGVAAAGVIGTAAVAYPLGMRYLHQVTGLGSTALWRRALGPWSARAAVLFLLGLGVGIMGWRASVWPPLMAAPVLGVLYLWAMRPLYAGLPLPERVRPVLVHLRLLPPDAVSPFTSPPDEVVDIEPADAGPHPAPRVS